MSRVYLAIVDESPEDTEEKENLDFSGFRKNEEHKSLLRYFDLKLLRDWANLT